MIQTQSNFITFYNYIRRAILSETVPYIYILIYMYIQLYIYIYIYIYIWDSFRENIVRFITLYM